MCRDCCAVGFRVRMQSQTLPKRRDWKLRAEGAARRSNHAHTIVGRPRLARRSESQETSSPQAALGASETATSISISSLDTTGICNPINCSGRPTSGSTPTEIFGTWPLEPSCTEVVGTNENRGVPRRRCGVRHGFTHLKMLWAYHRPPFSYWLCNIFRTPLGEALQTSRLNAIA